MTLTRRTLMATTVAFLATPAFAGKPEVFSGQNGFAINGFDPVAYFKTNGPVMGSDAYKTEYNGATFLFASPENKSDFDANPEKYAPQYGGYCAYAVSKGATAKTEPDAWTIVDDKLYLNFNTSVRDIWKQDIPVNISNANANWPKVLN